MSDFPLTRIEECETCGEDFVAELTDVFVIGDELRLAYDHRCPSCRQIVIDRNARQWEKQKQYNKGRGEYHRNRRKNNPEYFRRKESERRSRQAQLPHCFTDEDWAFCLSHFDHRCVYCGKQGKLHQEHFIPVNASACPGTVPENIVPSCGSCNSKKATRDAYKWLAERYDHDEAVRICSKVDDYFLVAALAQEQGR